MSTARKLKCWATTGAIRVSEKRKYGLLGRTLGHSLSPQIHELMFKYTELEGEYKLYPMEPEFVGDFILGLRENGFSGLNVTIPYKNEVMPYLDRISDEAKKIGSVNTVLPKGDFLEGYNTDYFGVQKMLGKAGIEVEGKRVMVLGSGGSAKTVVALMHNSGCADILLVSRDKKKAKAKFPDINTCAYADLKKDHGFDVLINTTPVGMYPKTESCPLEDEIIMGFGAVADLIYNPYETVLLKKAKKYGANCVNGLYMLVAQAVKAQEIWNGITIEDCVIDRIFSDIEKEIIN